MQSFWSQNKLISFIVKSNILELEYNKKNLLENGIIYYHSQIKYLEN